MMNKAMHVHMEKLVLAFKPTVEKAIQHSLSINTSGAIHVADLGCGPSPFSFISTVLETVLNINQRRSNIHHHDEDELQLPPTNNIEEMHMYLNDLPSNDFNNIFNKLTSFQHQDHQSPPAGVALFVNGVPGSFYGRLFPKNHLHLVTAAYSAHWLSKAPCQSYINGGTILLNKGTVHISDTSPSGVAEAYSAQFEQDFTLFLQSRAAELVPNGYMVLLQLVKSSYDPDTLKTIERWESRVLSQAISRLISRGLIKEGKLDSFDLPLYAASKEELEYIVDKQRSFSIEHLETKLIYYTGDIQDRRLRAKTVAQNVRAFSESLISHHFGSEIVEPLYDELAQVAFDLLGEQEFDSSTIILMLRKKSI